MKKVLFDTNVIVDILLARGDFAPHALALLKLAENNVIKGYVSAASVADIHYIVRKATKSEERTMEGVGYMLDILRVAKVTKKVIQKARYANWDDFEDAIQYECAVCNRLHCIVTRNEKDFSKSTIPVLSPQDFLAEFKR